MPRTIKRRRSQVDTAYARLKSNILLNKMPPGYQASEPSIAGLLAMSRTPVREALLRLQAEGLLKLVPRHGARVLPVSPVDTREIYDLLTVLEPEAAASLSNNLPSEGELLDLVIATENMELALDAKDLTRWAVADDRFHRHLAALTDNSRYAQYLNELLDYAHRARMFTLCRRSLPVQSTQEHRAILEHIRAGDAASVRQEFRRHRERTAAELLEILERYHCSQP